MSSENIVLQKEIAARKVAEEKLQNAYNELKQVQLQLFQSAKMASLGTLVGGVAHEINNPLTGVLNNVQLIKMLAKEQETFNLNDFNELLDIIEDSAVRCVKIIRSLLDLSRVSGEKFVRLGINEVVEEVLVLVKHDFSLENILIKEQLACDLVPINGDRQLLAQIMMNLLSNARWAIKKKSSFSGGAISIKTENNPAEPGINIIFVDNGIGIPSEKLNNLFDPFFTTKEAGEGTGLGLSIVHSIIKAHRGRIEVQSEKNQGLTFKIFFPAA